MSRVLIGGEKGKSEEGEIMEVYELVVEMKLLERRMTLYGPRRDEGRFQPLEGDLRDLETAEGSLSREAPGA